MSKQIGLLTLHGMGRTMENYHQGLTIALRKKLGPDIWQKIAFESVYYQKILQENQERTWTRMEENAPLRWDTLRKFLLFSLSDAGSLEHKIHSSDSSYTQTQWLIREALDNIHQALGYENKPLIIVAHSLGCQVISSYIWDAQQKRTQYGIWEYPITPITEAEIIQDYFLRLKTLRFLFTTGCNIPVFVAGHKKIEAIKKPNPQFQWFNFYDQDDPLGWPLKPLSPSYNEVVTADLEINVGTFFTHWNPLSHTEYWTDRDFINPLSTTILDLLSTQQDYCI